MRAVNYWVKHMPVAILALLYMRFAFLGRIPIRLRNGYGLRNWLKSSRHRISFHGFGSHALWMLFSNNILAAVNVAGELSN